jgi:hypothetical protein
MTIAVDMRARRRLPLVGMLALVAFLGARLPIAFRDSAKRMRDAWQNRSLDADSALAKMRGPEYVDAIRRIREVLPADSRYLLLSSANGADVFARFDLAPRWAILGGKVSDVSSNVTLARLPTLPEWTVIPLLDPPGPRLVRTRLLAEQGSVP